MTWSTVALEELTEPGRSITYGVVKPGDHDASDGVLFVRGGDIGDGRIAIEELRTITKQVSNQYRRTLLHGGELLISLVGNPGAVAMVPTSLIGANIARQAGLVALRDGVNHKFVEFFLRSPQGQASMGLYVKGAVQKVINLGDLKRVEVPLPPLPTQQRIAAILSAYDDLIETNTRRIAILEEMARRLYDEWFVHFRFPGHEMAEFDGELPRGWQELRLDSLVTTQYGYTASTSQEPVGPMFLRGMDINKRSYIDWSQVPFCPIEPEAVQKYRLVSGDLLVIRMADPGKIGFIEEDVEAVFASYLVRLKIKSDAITPLYLFFVLTGDAYQDYITGASTGTTRKSASAGVITGFDLIVPPRRLLEQFHKVAEPIRGQINALVKKNANLRAQRDLLLPKLVSGEIDVSEAEAGLEAAE